MTESNAEGVTTLNSRIFWLWALVVVALSCAVGWPWFEIQHARVSDLMMGDMIDQIRIVQGLERAHSWGDTLKWWYGPWVATPEVDFYRPLTSLVWWLEFQAFGGRAHAALGFTIVHLLSHVGACLLLVGFLRRLIGDRLALLSVGIWATGVALCVTLPNPQGAMRFWRDDPDLWITSAIVVCLGALLSYWQTGKRRFLLAAIVAQVTAICFKEMGYVAPLLALAVLWHQSPRPVAIALPARVRTIALLFGIVAVAVCYRFWALQGYGFRFGTNGSWFGRWMMYVIGGRPAMLFAQREFAPVGVALGLFAIWALFRRRYAVAVGLASVGTSLILLHDSMGGIANETFYRLISPFPWWAATLYRDFMIAAILLSMWSMCFRYRDRDQIFGFAWVALAYVPLLSAPITEHALYLPSVGWGIWIAAVLRRLGRNSLAWWHERAAINRSKTALTST